MTAFSSKLSGAAVAAVLVASVLGIFWPQESVLDRMVERVVPRAQHAALAPLPEVDQVLEHVYDYMASRLHGVAGRPVPPAHARLIAEVLVASARQAGFDPLFIVAVVEVESKWDVDAHSPTGARGLMQLLSSTFAEVSKYHTQNDPEENVRAGVAYLSVLYKGGKGFTRPDSILRAYNGGPGTAMRYNEVARAKGDLSAFSVEVRTYPGKVLTIYRRLIQETGGDHKRPEKTWRTP